MVINLHGVGPIPREVDSGEADCWISEDFLVEVLKEVAHHPECRITVDDGNASDYSILLPRLRECGLTATFFPSTGLLGRPTYLSVSQLQVLRKAGMPVGSHGVEHRPWRRMGEEKLLIQLRQSRNDLEGILGEPITLAACPFGEYDLKVVRALRLAGYVNAYTSDGTLGGMISYLIHRRTIRSSMSLQDVRALLTGGRNPLQRLGADVRCLLKMLRPAFSTP